MEDRVKRMNSFNQSKWSIRAFILIGCLHLVAIRAHAATISPVPAAEEIRLVEIQGAVEISRGGATTWSPSHTNQVLHPSDRLRIGSASRCALRWSDQSIISFGASSELEILSPQSPADQSGLHLTRGILSFFHRDKPGRIRIITRGAVAGVEGTELVLAVNADDQATLSVVDGRVRFANEHATLVLTNGQQAIAEPGKAPARTAGFIANNLLQWCFYYPAVLDLADLSLTDDENKILADSLAAYRAGDLLAALANYPSARQPASESERIYHAALLLSVGEVEKTETELAALTVTGAAENSHRLAAALRQLISAVKNQPSTSDLQPSTSSGWLAESYSLQSQSRLTEALTAARDAAATSPQSGFAQARVAELEFSFGHTRAALTALDKSLQLAPRNAQALALKGFVFAAQNKTREALVWFDRSLAVDSALGNAWLGRGLCKIKRGDAMGGREDLLVAAALEPQRAELRSYLGKAYLHTGDTAHAAKELELAKKLDPKDPTAWLYSALLNQQKNLINDAIRDLEKSKSLNGNRSVYRSQLLLDQDQAVRSANLASVYRDAGMADVSVREAGRAVSSDYANYSAHLFLAQSYEQLRDPNWSNLRYETPANSEYWIANLLAPAGAGTLSPLISERPGAKLFGQDRFGVVSETTYLSRGAWTEAGAQFGTFGNFSYDLTAKYSYDPGQRPNNDSEHRDVVLTLKQQITPQDSVIFSVEQNQVNSGDVSQRYDPATASPDFRVDEKQEPNLFLGYHHEWSPGVHTLFFVTRGEADVHTRTESTVHPVGWYYEGEITATPWLLDSTEIGVSAETYSAELQQIWQQAEHTTVIGGRYSWGNLRFRNIEWYPIENETHLAGSIFLGILGDDEMADPRYPFKIADQNIATDFHHLKLYGYHDWQIADPLKLSVGIAYDSLHKPSVVDAAPFNDQTDSTSQLSPKAGLIWTPTPDTVVRAAYTRSLSGFISDSSHRIEPTQVAGFNQAYRSLIPESVAGDTSGSQLDTFQLLLEHKFDTGTYISLSGELLYSQTDKLQAAYNFYGDLTDPPYNILYPIYPDGLRKKMDYRERSLTFTVDQLLGREWSAGARYRLSQANLEVNYTDVNPAALDPFNTGVVIQWQPRQNLESLLHTVNLHANWNHSSGLFSVLEANWYHQSNAGYSPDEPGDDFCQFNAYAGYRFWHRRAELAVGLLNIGNQSYRLEPLNLHNEMARSRTFFARLRISF